MIGQILIYSIALICTNAIEENPNICASENEMCQPNNKNSCCDNFECKWSDPAMRYQCRQKAVLKYGYCTCNRRVKNWALRSYSEAQLKDHCQITDDCSNVLHSTCLSGSCVCRKNHVVMNNVRCVPQLKEFCWKESCAPDNSVCVENECQCSSGFFAVGNHRCSPMLLDGPCDDDSACKSIRGALCASNKTCVCSDKTIMKSQVICAMRLGETCINDTECGVINSECINNKCQCKSQYLPASNTECKNGYVGMHCDNSEYCESYIINTICFHGLCLCKFNYTPWTNKLCVPSSNLLYCESDIDCEDKNSICVNNSCQCTSNYLLQGTKCLAKYLGGPCNVTSDCINIDSAVCQNNKCTCEIGNLPVNRRKCDQGLGKNCSAGRDCIVQNSQCIQNQCSCREGYTKISEKQCVTNNLQGSCNVDDDCQLVPNAQCSKGQCICKENHIEDKTRCAPLLGANCSIYNRCFLPDFVCINNKCECPLNYVPRSNLECVREYFDKPCDVDTNCRDVSNAECLDIKNCVCHTNFVRLDPFKCSPLLRGYCNRDTDCITKHSKCLNNECQCSRGYTSKHNYICMPVSLGGPCNGDEDCQNILNGKCSESNVCICKSNYLKFDQLECLPLVGEHCNENKECYVYNSNCVDNKCQCLENYLPFSNSKCVANYFNNFCLSDGDCESIVNSHCSSINRCACNRYFIAGENGKCNPILDGRCSENSDCVIANSHCPDHYCQCKPNFLPGIHNNCLPTRLNESCNTDNDCSKIEHAQCIGHKCICWGKYTASNSTKCDSLLDGSCYTDDDCLVSDSVCVEYKCQCKIGFQKMSNKCLPISLGHACKANNDCEKITKGICSKDKICICPEDTFALNERACSLRLNTFCIFDECDIEFSDCIDRKCQCKPGYSAMSSTQCMKTDLLHSCMDISYCADNWHFECSEHMCVCKDHNILVNDSSCLPILGGICWNNHQCTTENSLCIDYHCKCKPDFFPISDNLCVYKYYKK